MYEMIDYVETCTEYYIECARCGAVGEYCFSAAEAVQEAKELGFAVVGDRVLCKRCRKKHFDKIHWLANPGSGLVW